VDVGRISAHDLASRRTHNFAATAARGRRSLIQERFGVWSLGLTS